MLQFSSRLEMDKNKLVGKGMLQKGQFRSLREAPLSIEEHRLRRAIHGAVVFTRLDIKLMAPAQISFHLSHK